MAMGNVKAERELREELEGSLANLHHHLYYMESNLQKAQEEAACASMTSDVSQMQEIASRGCSITS